MTQKIIRRFGSVLSLVLFALVLVSATTSDSAARNHKTGRHGTSHGKSKHAANSRNHGKHYARLSHNHRDHSVKVQPALTSEQKAEIIEKIKTLAKASVVDERSSNLGDDSLVAQEAISPDVQSQIAEAAKEEMAEDDVDVSLSNLFGTHACDSMTCQLQRQQDFTLFDESDPGRAAQRSDVMAEIIDWLGTKYYFGGQDRGGIDCSAFTRTVFQKAFGFELPRTAFMQYQMGGNVKKEELAFGDLVFFHTAKYASITHVGIYLGEGLFANAACSKGVSVASLSSTYWSKHFAGAKRLFANGSMASAKMSATRGTMADNFVGPVSGN